MKGMLVTLRAAAGTSLAALAMVAASANGAASQSQAPNPTQRHVSERDSQTPVYRVTVVARTTPAVNYRHRGGATKVDFRGTSLLPRAHGEAKVESKQGYIEIEVEFDELQPAAMFGPEYLTYVMWAITPEGRATNLGEVLLNGTESKLNVTTELQAFGLVVTAEPYFAVTQPSDVVVMENVVRPDTRGNVEQVQAKYELLKRGTYLMDTSPSALTPVKLDDDTPIELREAHNAVQLSRIAGADEFALETYQKARGLLQEAEDRQERGAGRRAVVMIAREAVQTAEDARLIALERQEAQRAALAREAAARREAEAVARAQSESEARRQAEAERLAAERARSEAAAREAEATARARAEAERRERAEADRLAADRARSSAEQAASEAARQQADAEAARLAAERARADADAAAQRLAEERAAAEAARAASIAEAERARQEAERARLAAQSAEQEKAELRARLQQQLNLVLETRETARGLIVNMSDVLFDFNRHTLRPGAREKLAKVAGILLAYPGLELQVEGHTDSVGSDTYNDRLSERRAEAVREFLVQQGIPTTAISARGFGESRPVVSNDNAAGRQQNRRVELVVSGEPIQNTAMTSRR